MQNCAGIRATGPPLSALTAQLSGVQGVDLIFLYHLVHCCITAGITTLCDEGDRKNIHLISNRYQGFAKTATLQFNKRAVWSTEELERKSHFSTHKRDFTEGWMQSCGTPALHSHVGPCGTPLPAKAPRCWDRLTALAEVSMELDNCSGARVTVTFCLSFSICRIDKQKCLRTLIRKIQR